MMSPIAHRNPYVGPRAFRTGETLYGRDRETAELRDLLIAERIVVLYSPSGAGKTSLVQAALVPALEREGFRVLPVVRVNLDPAGDGGRNGSRDGATTNRYLLSALHALEEPLPPELRRPVDELATLDLATYLGERPRAGADGGQTPEVLIFDQFEEILTVDPTDQAAKAAFFAQVGAALRDRGRWALFSLREDYLAGLDPYRRPIPTLLANRFRLDLLGPEGARLAIQRPARDEGVDFTDGAARRLVADLSRVLVERNGELTEQSGPWIEPVQLQVVCRRVWDTLPPGKGAIEEGDVGTVGDVDTALADYYAEQVASVAAVTGVGERAIREWIDHQLITKQGIRGQILLEPERSQGLDNRAIWALVDAHLVRAEKRRGATWLELAHDRLIEPIRTSNQSWFAANLSVLQREAEVWADHGRARDLLLGGRLLGEAERWAGAHAAELLPVEREFLDASRDARRNAIRRRLIAAGLATVLVLSSLWSWWSRDQAVDARREADAARGLAVAQSGRAETQAAAAAVAARTAEAASSAEAAARATAEAEATAADAARLAAVLERNGAQLARREADAARATVEAEQRVTLARQVAAEAAEHIDDRIDTALLLSLEANQLTDTPVAEARESLLAGVGSLSGARLFGLLRGHQDRAMSVAYSPDGNILASASLDGDILLWGAGSRSALGPPLAGPRLGVYDVAFSPDGRLVAAAGLDGAVTLWEVATGRQFGAPLPGPPDGSLYSVAFSPADPNTVAAAGDNGAVLLWDIAAGGPARAFGVGDDGKGHDGIVTEIAFDPVAGSTLVSTGTDGRVILWDVASGEWQGDLPASEAGEFFTLAISSDGATVAAGGASGKIFVWNIATRTAKWPPLTAHINAVWGLAFTEDGTTLASGGTDKRIILWDLATGAPHEREPPFTGYADAAYDLAFSPNGDFLASAGGDGTIVLWNRWAVQPFARPAVGVTSAVSSIAFDGETVVSASTDGSLDLWDSSTGEWQDSRSLETDDAPVFNTVVLSRDGKTLATGGCGTFDQEAGDCRRGEVRLWEVASGRPRGRPLAGHDGWVTNLVFSTDGTTLVSGGLDGTIRRWDAVTGAPRGGLPAAYDGAVTSLALRPDGRVLAAGYEGGEILLWDLTVGEPIAEPGGHERQVLSLAFSPDGTTLASGGQDTTILLWDAATGARLSPPLTEHRGPVRGLAFGRDGRTLASASADRSVILWDPDAQRAITRPLIHPYVDAVTAVTFDREGRTLASGAEGPTEPLLHVAGYDWYMPMVLWDLDAEHWREVACAVAGRNLTREEWERYIGREPAYRSTCLEGLLSEADALWLAGDGAGAGDAFGRAVALVGELSDADFSNEVCWRGSLGGAAPIVMPACKQAVELAEKDRGATMDVAFYRDTRGLARALVGDEHAVEDFEAFVAWASGAGLEPHLVDQRRAWIATLRAGGQPFGPDTLRALRAEAFGYAQVAESTPAASPVETPVGSPTAVGSPVGPGGATPAAPTAASPPAASPSTAVGGSFVGPTFGWGITWDGSWTVVEPGMSSGVDDLQLTDGLGTLYLDAVVEVDDDPERCLREMATDIHSRDGFGTVLPRRDATGRPLRGGDGGRAYGVWNFTFTFEDGSRSRWANHLECRRLPGGAVLRISFEVPAAEYDREAAAMERLLASLVLLSPAGTPVSTPDG